MSGDYRVVVSEASTGRNLAELPLDGLTFSRQLSGCGSLSGSLPVDHPAATEDNLGQHRADPDREISVFRDDVPVWNGPLTGTDASLSSGTVNITAREASWYLGKRVLEEDRDYDGDDLFDIVRDLDTYMEGKQATGDDGMTLGDDIVAGLPRYSVSSGLAGVALTDASPPTFYGSARHTIQECLDALAADPETGFEWRMDYSTGSTRTSVHRTLTLGYPALGVTRTELLNEKVLLDFSRTCDWERAATRVHVIGSGFTKTTQSAEAVSNGTLLLEVVDDLTDVTKEDFITARARDLRRLSRPPVRSFTASYIPGSALPYGFCDLGDVVPFEITWPPILSITADTRRVVEISVTPDEQEVVKLTINDRLDDLGA